MFESRRLALGAALALSSAYAVADPGVFEVDLVFPRNGTYAPVSLMPIVFGIQNPALASPLGIRMTWSVLEYNDNGSVGPFIGLIDLRTLDPSSSNPYFLNSYLGTLSGIESTWVFQWVLSSANCSQTEAEPTYDNQFKSIIFTTNNSSPAPDLEAVTSPTTCSTSPGVAFNVTAVEPFYGFDMPAPGQSSCAVLGSPAATLNPCAAAINSSAASSITAALSLSACSATQFSCSSTPTSAKSEADRSFMLPTTWVLIALGLLLHVLRKS